MNACLSMHPWRRAQALPADPGHEHTSPSSRVPYPFSRHRPRFLEEWPSLGLQQGKTKVSPSISR